MTKINIDCCLPVSGGSLPKYGGPGPRAGSLRSSHSPRPRIQNKVTYSSILHDPYAALYGLSPTNFPHEIAPKHAPIPLIPGSILLKALENTTTSVPNRSMLPQSLARPTATKLISPLPHPRWAIKHPQPFSDRMKMDHHPGDEGNFPLR